MGQISAESIWNLVSDVVDVMHRAWRWGQNMVSDREKPPKTQTRWGGAQRWIAEACDWPLNKSRVLQNVIRALGASQIRVSYTTVHFKHIKDAHIWKGGMSDTSRTRCLHLSAGSGKRGGATRLWVGIAACWLMLWSQQFSQSYTQTTEPVTEFFRFYGGTRCEEEEPYSSPQERGQNNVG